MPLLPLFAFAPLLLRHYLMFRLFFAFCFMHFPAAMMFRAAAATLILRLRHALRFFFFSPRPLFRLISPRHCHAAFDAAMMP